MQCKKNLTLKLKILTVHFTGVQKIITLRLLILMLSLINITLCLSNSSSNSVSALSYESSVGIGFTFNPTLSVSLSSSDLIISNLAPNSSENSNSINVSVATNAAYGYTLSATVGDNTHNNSNLTHSNNTNIFSSIATDASLSSLTTDNTWGYSTKLPNETNWNNYNGLSNSTNTTLIDNNNTADSTGSIDFKIGARAGSTQASGIYTNTINFIAVSKVAPMSLLDSFIASGAEQYNGYFKMQDMTHDICSNVDIEESELQLIDVRDNKIYWVAKLKDGNCWMTQNLDLDLDSTKTYTHWDTDLGWSTLDENATWQPTNSSRTPTDSPQWVNSSIHPISYNPGNLYWNGELNPSTSGNLSNMASASGNSHYYIGNYYNWTAAVASNDTSDITSGSMLNSICPSSWKMPSTTNFQSLIQKENLTSGPNGNIQLAPVYFVYSGLINSYVGNYGYVWANSAINTAQSYHLRFTYTAETLHPNNWGNRHSSYIVRCLTR